MARTNIVLDDKLIAELMKLSGKKTKRELVDTALRMLLERERAYAAFRRARGKIQWEGDLDALRRDRR